MSCAAIYAWTRPISTHPLAQGRHGIQPPSHTNLRNHRKTVRSSWEHLETNPAFSAAFILAIVAHTFEKLACTEARVAYGTSIKTSRSPALEDKSTYSLSLAALYVNPLTFAFCFGVQNKETSVCAHFVDLLRFEAEALRYCCQKCCSTVAGADWVCFFMLFCCFGAPVVLPWGSLKNLKKV